MSDESAVQTVSADDITPLDMPPPTGEPVAQPIPQPDSVSENLRKNDAHDAHVTPADEIDRGGVKFDGKRHLRRLHPTTGRWMPKGGRRPKSPAASSRPGVEQPSYIPASVPPAPPSPDSVKTITDEIPSAAQSTAADDQADAAGECAARALQFAAGIVFDSPDDCTPPGPEHRSMVRAFAAYIRAKGWQGTAGTSVFLVIVAWVLRVLMKEKPRAAIRGWIDHAKAKAARDVTPPDAAPAPSSSAVNPRVSNVIDLPPNIPPLAPSSRS